MKRLLLSMMLFPGIAAANAPFCMVSGAGGSQCHYWDLNSCRQAAASVDGLCTANPQAMQPAQQVQPIQQQQRPVYQQPQLVLPDYAGEYRRSVEAGQRARQSREEHEARMRVLAAQEAAYRAQAAAAAPQQAAPQAQPSGEMEAYRCQSEQGAIRYSSAPIPGLSCTQIVGPQASAKAIPPKGDSTD